VSMGTLNPTVLYYTVPKGPDIHGQAFQVQGLVSWSLRVLADEAFFEDNNTVIICCSILLVLRMHVLL